METIAEALAASEARRAAGQTREDWVTRILSELPADLPAPTISNEGEKAMDGQPGAWASFSRDYGEKWQGSEIFASLERAGFKTMPATLAQYGKYRRGVHPGLQTEIPEEYSRSKLTDCEPIVPVWLVPSCFGEGDAVAFYRSPAGLLLRVKVSPPAGIGMHATRKNIRGGWYYERGTAKLRYPEAWHSVHDASGNLVSQICVHSRAYVDTEHGISGAIYFTPFLDQSDFPMTAAEFLKALGG